MLALHLAALAVCAAAQSSDPEQPTPTLSSEITGRIAPRDVGDPRRTRHFYAFGAQQGDLEITVEGTNLEGDVDLFTAATLRPLAKVTLYAGLGAPVTRTVFMRRPESLVLRVQARTPNDAEGSYRIRLGGTFVPAVASNTTTPEPSPAESAAASPARAATGRRVTSTGARIDEPRQEPTPEAAVARVEEPAATPEPAAPSTPPRRTTTRGRAGTREGTRRGSSRAGTAADRAARDAERSRDEAAAREEPAAETPPATTREEAAASPATRTNRTRPPRGRTGGTARRGGQAPAETEPNAATTEPAAPTGLELPGTRLVLELREGGRVEREMSEVRRVAVERGMIVITHKSGRTERQPLSNVLRMSIEP
ncbi:MAG TPA: hypothetical protein VK421_01540 [Pyrinomonadaceae bacterium]|nr:hypothetical protein [Pyrinomonadaceae bacterium]